MAAGDQVSNQAPPPDLAARLERLEVESQSAFGPFAAIDFIVSAILFLVLPLLAVWWAR